MRDKRIVTLVYTDMEGSPRLLASLRDAFLPVLERRHAIPDRGAHHLCHGAVLESGRSMQARHL
jgi:hypothetical protein